MNPDKVPFALKVAFAAKKPVMLWGPPGIGKSSVVAQVAAESVDPETGKGRDVFDIRLALLDPTDLRGIPFYNPESKMAEWADTSILPQDPESTAVVFLDELNAAPPVVQAAAYQLILDRRIGDYYLPEGCDIVAAGNREGDKGVVFKMPSPLLNRFVHLEFESDFNSWYNWAIKGALHPHVIGYIKHRPDALMKFDPSSKSRGFPTPRTWSFASDLLIEGNKMGADTATMSDLLKGTIGEGVAIEFMAYLNLVDKLPSPMEILKGNVKKLNKVDISAKYSLIIALGQRLKTLHDEIGGKGADKKAKENWFGYVDNYYQFITDNFEEEFCVLGVRDCFKTLKLPMAQAPLYRSLFVKKHGDLVMEA